VIVGPSLADIGLRARTRVEGLTAEEYLHQSIVEPDAYVVEGFDPGIMYQDFEDALTDEQLYDLEAFLLTLE
jgi:cytochrome c